MKNNSEELSRSALKEEKFSFDWECYYKKATPKLLELIEYCQKDNRIVPRKNKWGLIGSRYMGFTTNRNKFTVYPPFKVPLILDGSSAPDLEKRYRLLTQIYWCYKYTFIDRIYEDIMELSDNDWIIGRYQEDKISLELIKKEYANWLGVKYYPEHSIWNHCANHHKKHIQIQKAEEIYDKRNHILDDEGTTFINER